MFLLNGQIPVASKLLIMFGMLNTLNHAFAKSSQKSKRDTVLPGLRAQNLWHVSLHATFRGAKHPLSKGWVMCVVCGGKAHSTICCVAAIAIVSGQ